MKKNKVQELEAKLIQGKSAVECLAILIELAELHAATFHNREGIRCAREALNIARVRNDAHGAARARAAAMRCHFQRGEFVSAVADGLDAVHGFGDADVARRSGALQGVAQALIAVESFDLAADVAERAAADARAAGDRSAEAGARALWGSILVSRARYGEARRQFREAGAIHRSLGDTVAMKRSAASLARGYLAHGNNALQQGDPDQARSLWRHAIRVFRVAAATGESLADDALCLAGMAECEMRLDNGGRALAVVRQAVELAGQSRNPLALSRSYLWESHALKAAGKIEAGRRACECARDAAEQLDHDPLLAECLRAESLMNDLSGRFESAQDLEQRAERVELEREAHLARVREEVGMLLVRHASPGTVKLVAAAA
jgi:tetratricopeptide (TPR) repeat protein